MSVPMVTLDIAYRLSDGSTGTTDTAVTESHHAAMQSDERWIRDHAVKMVALRTGANAANVHIESVRVHVDSEA